MNTLEYLKQQLTPIANKELFPIDDLHAHDEWIPRNTIRFCNVYTIRDGVPVATVAICTPKMNEQEALRQAVIRLG